MISKDRLASIRKVLDESPAPAYRVLCDELLEEVARLRLEAASRRIQKVETQEDKVLLYRRGEPITVGNRLPRLTARNAGARLDELIKIIRACGWPPSACATRSRACGRSSSS